MMRTKLTLLCALCLLSWTGIGAQNLSGKLIDEEEKPLSYANVVLLSLPDSAFVAGTVSGEDGTFALQAAGGSQLLRVSSIGYLTLYHTVGGSDVGTLRMQPDAQLLGEVVVKGTLPKTRLKGDAMLTNIAGTVLEKAGTAADLLDRIPGVSSQGGTVNVFGRGTPEIYINGRKMRSESELDQLASDNIKSVEVVRNPGARYDASVTAVIRITTKKAVGEGFGFNNRFYTGYQYGWNVLDQFNFNYRKRGFDLAGMLFAYDSHYGEDKVVWQDTYLHKHWNQRSPIRNRGHYTNYSGMLSLNYQFDEKHSMGVRYDYDSTPNQNHTLEMQTDVLQDNAAYEYSDSRNESSASSEVHRVNLYYNGQVGHWQIDFNADGMWSGNDDNALAAEQLTMADGTESRRTVSSLSEVDNDLYAAKLVFSHPLWGGNASFGAEYSHTSRSNLYLNPEHILEDDDSRIRESSTSAFVEYARALGKAQVQAGVRYEHVGFDYYEQDRYIDEQSRSYNNVFPSVALSLPFGPVQTQLSYSIDVKRPYFNQLRSNILYANRYTYEGGNPLLQPTLTHSAMLNASYKWVLFSVGYEHVMDDIEFSTTSYDEANPTIALMRPVNLPEYDRVQALLVLSPVIGIWRPQFRAALQKQWFMGEGPEGALKLNSPIGSFGWQNSLELPAGFLLSVDGSFQTGGHAGNIEMTRTSWSVDASLYKGFFNDRLTFRLQAYDLFQKNMKWAKIYSGIRTTELNNEARRSISLTVRYKFNSTKSKYRGTGAGSGQKSRM